MEHGLSGEYIKFASVEVHFTFSENVTRFEESHVIAEGGVVSNFVQNGNMMYSALFTSDGTDGLKSLRVLSGAVADRAGNTNDATETFQWTLDTTLPTVTLSTLEGNSGFHSSALSLEFSLLFSENVTIANPPDFEVVGGEIGDVVGSGAM